MDLLSDTDIIFGHIINVDTDSYVINNKCLCINFLNECNIDIDGINKLYLINLDKSITINMLDNAELDLYMYGNKDMDITLNVIQSNDTKLNMYLGLDISKSNLLINSDVNGNNNFSDIKIKVITDNKSNLVVNTKVLENTFNNEANESLKGIKINDAIIKFEPNLDIFTNEVIANHLATITTVSKDDVFYLMNKGLDRKTSEDLILDGFIFSDFDDKFKNKIRKEYYE